MTKFKRVFGFIFEFMAIFVLTYFVSIILGIIMMAFLPSEEISLILEKIQPILVIMFIIAFICRTEIFNGKSIVQLFANYHYEANRRIDVVFKNFADLVLFPISFILLLIKSKTLGDIIFNVKCIDESPNNKWDVKYTMMVIWLCMCAFTLTMFVLRISSNMKIQEKYKSLSTCEVSLSYKYKISGDTSNDHEIPLTSGDINKIKYWYSSNDFKIDNEEYYGVNPTYEIKICDDVIDIWNKDQVNINNQAVKNTNFSTIYNLLEKKTDEMDKVYVYSYCSFCDNYSYDIPITDDQKKEIRQYWEKADKTLYKEDFDDLEMFIKGYGISIDGEFFDISVNHLYAKYMNKSGEYLRLSDEFRTYLEENIFNEEDNSSK